MNGSLQRIWGLFFAIGLVTTLLGILIIAPSTVMAGRPLELMLAVILILGGVAAGIHALMAKEMKGGQWTAGLAVIRLATGITILVHPLDTYMTFTTLIGIFFILDGALSAGLAMSMRGDKLVVWPTLGAAMSIIFALLIWLYLGGASYIVIASLVGITFIVRGALTITMALTLRKTGLDLGVHQSANV